MLFLSRVVPALLAASSLVQAAVVTRGGDDFISGFIDALNKKNLTDLADSYEKVAKTEDGKRVFDQLENKGDITLLAPSNCAFEPDYPKLDAETLLYNAIFGSIDNGFKSDYGQLTRRQAAQSRSVASSGAGISGGGGRKRQDANYQVQVVDQTFTPGSRKRTYGPEITIGQAVGDAKVVDRFKYKNIDILVIKELLYLPGKASDLLCKPLIKSAPNGFTKAKEALEKTGLTDDLDNGKLLTAFIPIDEGFDHGDKLSKDELTCLVKNHFFFGKRVFSPLFEKVGSATALSGEKLVFSVENGIHYVCCGKSKATVLRSDVISGRGVLHVIDQPLECK